jgi:nuclear RNA export factor
MFSMSMTWDFCTSLYLSPSYITPFFFHCLSIYTRSSSPFCVKPSLTNVWHPPPLAHGQLAARTQPGGASDILTIRGASTVGRLRRNVVTTAVAGAPSKAHAVPVKAVEVWREFVNRRWNPESRFLNLEVSRHLSSP